MKILKKTAFFLCVAASAICAAASPSILTLSDHANDSTIIYPESVETDTHKMMQNWYLRTYTALDRDVDSRPDVTTSDEEIIKRLQSIPTTIELPFNSIVRNYIDLYTGRKRSLVESMLGMSLYYMPIFEQALERENLPMELKYLPVIESAMNPDAVSRSGATGLWQLMLATARGFNMEVNTLVDERRDPVASSATAAKLLRQLYDIYHDWSLAIAAYNCGPGNVNKALARAGGESRSFWDIYDFLPRETRGYVPAFIGASYAYSYHRNHGIEPEAAPIPLSVDTIRINRLMHFEQIASTIDIPMETLRQLNPQYKLDIIPATTKTYTLVLPQRKVAQYIAHEQEIMAKDSTYLKEYINPANIDKKRAEMGNTIHTVRSGETLSGIAHKYHISTAQIMRSNKLKNANRLRIGQKLIIERR